MMLIFSTWLEQLMKDGLNSNPVHLPCRQLHGMDYKLVFVIKYRMHRIDNKYLNICICYQTQIKTCANHSCQ